MRPEERAASVAAGARSRQRMDRERMARNRAAREAPASVEPLVQLVDVEREQVAWLMCVGTYRDLPNAARVRAVPVVEWIEARLAEDRIHVAELVCSCTPEFRGFHGKHHADCPALKVPGGVPS